MALRLRQSSDKRLRIVLRGQHERISGSGGGEEAADGAAAAAAPE
jgi:hypothetical protein